MARNNAMYTLYRKTRLCLLSTGVYIDDKRTDESAMVDDMETFNGDNLYLSAIVK